jgi:hypothetical protein
MSDTNLRPGVFDDTMPRRGIVKSNDLPHLEVVIADTRSKDLVGMFVEELGTQANLWAMVDSLIEYSESEILAPVTRIGVYIDIIRCVFRLYYQNREEEDFQSVLLTVRRMLPDPASSEWTQALALVKSAGAHALHFKSSKKQKDVKSLSTIFTGQESFAPRKIRSGPQFVNGLANNCLRALRFLASKRSLNSTNQSALVKKPC